MKEETYKTITTLLDNAKVVEEKIKRMTAETEQIRANALTRLEEVKDSFAKIESVLLELGSQLAKYCGSGENVGSPKFSYVRYDNKVVIREVRKGGKMLGVYIGGGLSLENLISLENSIREAKGVERLNERMREVAAEEEAIKAMEEAFVNALQRYVEWRERVLAEGLRNTVA